MARTVNSAFEQFLRETVNLDPTEVEKARASRDFLVDQLKQLHNKSSSFPRVVEVQHFGSFARGTKILTLDDIDIMAVLNTGAYRTVSESRSYSYNVVISYMQSLLTSFADSYGFVNSRKVLERLKNALASVAQYSKAEIHRNQEAVTLQLQSYPWNFDIVPALPYPPCASEPDYYLIPDGNGEWKKTDPRIDAERIKRVNDRHGGLARPLIRLVKYWCYQNKLGIRSYHLETLVVNLLNEFFPVSSIDIGITNLFSMLSLTVQQSCPDPKGFSGNLDAYMSLSQKIRASVLFELHGNKAAEACHYAEWGQHKEAITRWQEIFGSKFPSYG